jgi:hypothetical protein
MKNKFLALCISLSFVTVVLAQDEIENNTISTAVPSLSIAPDARGASMGDIGAATSADVNSQYWNPSKYVFMDSEVGFSLSYTPWLRTLVPDIDLAYLAGYWKFDPRQALSASLRYFSLGDIQLMNEFGYPENSAHPNEFAFDVAYSRLLSEKFSAAATMRLIYSDLGNGSQNAEMYPGFTVAADVSAYYKTSIPVENTDGTLAFGLNISNIGGKVSYDDNATSNFIPTNMRLGTSSITLLMHTTESLSVLMQANC